MTRQGFDVCGVTQRMDIEAFRDTIGEALDDTDAAPSATARVLEAYAASLRSRVRFPLDMTPAEARTFREEMADHAGDTLELEVVVTDELLDGLDIQLAAIDEGPSG